MNATATRTVYRDHLAGLMRRDRRVVCVDTDTGLFAGVDFGAAAERYVNVGIAEQNAIGMAAGLAADGWRPYVNTMAAFAASRALEAVKIDVAYNQLPVRIIGTHGGVSAGHLGPTHQALEDLAVMRTLPNLTVVVPGDGAATACLLDQIVEVPGPVYVRLGRKAAPELPRPPGTASALPLLGRLQLLRDGTDVVMVACGTLPVLRALDAAGRLDPAGGRVAVMQAHTIKPFDVDGLRAQAASARLVVTVEEHWQTGGLGSMVAEALTEARAEAPADGAAGAAAVLRLGFPDAFVATVGSPEQLLDAAGLSADGIAAAVAAAIPGQRAYRGVPA